MRRRYLLSSIALAAFAGCTGNDEEPEEDDEPEDEEETYPEEGERVEIIESELVREDAGTEEEAVAVHGIAQVKPDVEVSYVEIRARFYDAEDDLLDSTIEQVDAVDLHGEDDDPEGRRWEFEIVYPYTGERAAEVESYELEIGTEL
jgi:hypothetical protein